MSPIEAFATGINIYYQQKQFLIVQAFSSEALGLWPMPPLFVYEKIC